MELNPRGWRGAKCKWSDDDRQSLVQDCLENPGGRLAYSAVCTSNNRDPRRIPLAILITALL